MNQKRIIIGLAVAISIGLVFVFSRSDAPTPFSGVTAGNEYEATSTAASTVYGAGAIDALLKTGQGSLGSVIVTGAATGAVNFYDATTTNVLKRTPGKATSTILLFSLPPSLAVGTYVVDTTFTDGLLLDLDNGTMPTTTVTWR